MRARPLGRTGLSVSALTFGCGNVGGLMVRGTEADQREAVARALDAGVTYFDTAALYGEGRSEETLGRVLPSSERRAAVGTKVRLGPDDFAAPGGAAAAIRRALEDSLRRLRRERVDLYQFHNAVGVADNGHALPVERIVEEVLPAFEALRREGKVGAIGFTALGDPAAVERLAAAGGFETAQVPYNLLVPAAAAPAEGGTVARLLVPDRDAGLGTIGIRVLAGGALGGVNARHPIAAPTVVPIGTGQGAAADYDADLAASARFRALVEAGAAKSLPALAIRYALACEGLDTFAVGFSSLAHLQEALDAVAAGPLEAGTLAEIARIQQAAGAAPPA